jgi:hypothetical protein
MAEMATSLASGPAYDETAEHLDAAGLAERLVEAYMDIGDRSRDEHVIADAQLLARQAIGRLAWLRQSI